MTKQVTRVVFLLAAAIALAACPQPLPPAPPGPTPSDVFTGARFDCRHPVVAVERDSIEPDVKACLRGAGAPACLVGLTSQWQTTSIACVARDVGAKANADVLAGSADSGDAAMADNARAWIRAEGMGFK